MRTIGGNVFDALVTSPQGPMRLSLTSLGQAKAPNEPPSYMNSTWNVSLMSRAYLLHESYSRFFKIIAVTHACSLKSIQ